jgi:hypothetical protein
MSKTTPAQPPPTQPARHNQRNSNAPQTLYGLALCLPYTSPAPRFSTRTGRPCACPTLAYLYGPALCLPPLTVNRQRPRANSRKPGG